MWVAARSSQPSRTVLLVAGRRQRGHEGPQVKQRGGGGGAPGCRSVSGRRVPEDKRAPQRHSSCQGPGTACSRAPQRWTPASDGRCDGPSRRTSVALDTHGLGGRWRLGTNPSITVDPRTDQPARPGTNGPVTNGPFVLPRCVWAPRTAWRRKHLSPGRPLPLESRRPAVQSQTIQFVDAGVQHAERDVVVARNDDQLVVRQCHDLYSGGVSARTQLQATLQLDRFAAHSLQNDARRGRMTLEVASPPRSVSRGG